MPEILLQTIKLIPKGTEVQEVLRVVVTYLGFLEPESEENRPWEIAKRFIALMPPLAAWWYNWSEKDLELESLQTQKGDSIN